MQSEADHRALVEQVHQLNLLRESNFVLREDATRANAQLQEAKAQIQGKITAFAYYLIVYCLYFVELSQQLGPALEDKRLHVAKIEALEADLETRNNEIKHHRSRIQKLLDKYQVSDLAYEHMALKTFI